MLLISQISELQRCLASYRAQGHRIGFVPTMGYLHAGHLRLVQEAQKRSDIVVVSIFVNPLQFGPSEDFSRYPRNFEADQQALSQAGVDVLFFPDVQDMYPQGQDAHSFVEVPKISDILCGASRPGHFRGVATVVAKFFGIIGPCVACFGKKDFQQLAVIQRMVRDLVLPIEIVGIDTLRDHDGLALSSRNSYLSQDERKVAPVLYHSLRDTAHSLRDGHRDFSCLEEASLTCLRTVGFRPDYVRILSPLLDLPRHEETAFVVLGAAWLGATRLIDNIEVVATS